MRLESGRNGMLHVPELNFVWQRWSLDSMYNDFWGRNEDDIFFNNGNRSVDVSKLLLVNVLHRILIGHAPLCADHQIWRDFFYSSVQVWYYFVMAK